MMLAKVNWRVSWWRGGGKCYQLLHKILDKLIGNNAIDVRRPGIAMSYFMAPPESKSIGNYQMTKRNRKGIRGPVSVVRKGAQREVGTPGGGGQGVYCII